MIIPIAIPVYLNQWEEIKKMKNKITIVVPIYNGEQFVFHMISMLKKQTYDNIEVILINDGSTDNTERLCKEYIKDDDRFLLISQFNSGVSTARNVGIENATGKYITFVDVDDYIYPEYLEKLQFIINKYDADWVQCSFLKVPENSNPEKYGEERTGLDELESNRGKVIVFNQEDAIKDFAYRRHLTGFPYLKLIKTEVVKNLKFRKEYKYSEDYIYTFELLKRTKKIIYIDSVEYLYIQQKMSATHRKNVDLDAYFYSWKNLNQIADEVKVLYSSAYGGIIEKIYMQSIRNIARIGKRDSHIEQWDTLINFVKNNGISVFKDRNNKKFNRILGLIGGILPRFTCFICKVYFDMGGYLKKLS